MNRNPPVTSLKKQVLIVDDHPMIRERLGEVVRLEHDLDTCGEASDVDQVLVAMSRQKPDIVLLDLNLNGVLALDLIKDLSARYPSVPVLVISMHDESLFAERVLRAGAKGYLNKQKATKEVITAIRMVLANKIYVSEPVLMRMAELLLDAKKEKHPGALESLTDRELEVLELMGHGLRAGQIAEKLQIEERTVETYRTRIKEKLHLRNSSELLMRAMEWAQQRRTL